jgi:hypothetical protein
MARNGREAGGEAGEAGSHVGVGPAEPSAQLQLLFDSLRDTHRVAVWSADSRNGVGFLRTIDVPEDADPDWLLEHIRQQWGAGRYRLRPVGPAGKYLPGQATISIADDRTRNPSNILELLTNGLTQQQPRQAASGGGDGETTRLLLGALLDRQGAEGQTLRQLLAQRTDPHGELDRLLGTLSKVRRIFGGGEGEGEPQQQPSSPFGGGIEQYLLYMLMNGAGGMPGMPGMGMPGMPGMGMPGMGMPGMGMPGMPGMPGGFMPPGTMPWAQPMAGPPAPPRPPAPPAAPPPTSSANDGGGLAQVLAALEAIRADQAELKRELAAVKRELAEFEEEPGEGEGEGPSPVVNLPGIGTFNVADAIAAYQRTANGGNQP